jgi:ATP-dependent RNA helicase DDX5/DBP2
MAHDKNDLLIKHLNNMTG